MPYHFTDFFFKFQLVCDELKKKEHFIRYFKIRHSDITKLEDHIFMGIKIQHLYIHNSSEYMYFTA